MAQRGKSARMDGDDDDEREKSPAASEHDRGARYRKRSARGEGFVDSDVAFSQAQAGCGVVHIVALQFVHLSS